MNRKPLDPGTILLFRLGWDGVGATVKLAQLATRGPRSPWRYGHASLYLGAGLVLTANYKDRAWVESLYEHFEGVTDEVLLLPPPFFEGFNRNVEARIMGYGLQAAHEGVPFSVRSGLVAATRRGVQRDDSRVCSSLAMSVLNSAGVHHPELSEYPSRVAPVDLAALAIAQPRVEFLDPNQSKHYERHYR